MATQQIPWEMHSIGTENEFVIQPGKPRDGKLLHESYWGGNKCEIPTGMEKSCRIPSETKMHFYHNAAIAVPPAAKRISQQLLSTAIPMTQKVQ